MAEINSALSVITVNVSGWNFAIKRHRLAEDIRKHDPFTRCLQKHALDSKTQIGWKHKNGKQRTKQKGTKRELIWLYDMRQIRF